jgi:hypothetical protein
MSKGLKIFGIISAAILLLTLVYSISIYIDILASYDPSSGNTFGNLGYLLIAIYGMMGAGLSSLLNVIGLIIGIVKKQKPSIIFYAILLGIVVLFVIFVFLIGPKFLPGV